ncbi:MAG: DUF86 domain-containing protein [Isosphaeraceae bacterium]
MPRDPNRRIDDIIACCEKILRFRSGLDHEQLAAQELVMDAILRNIEVIGEAAKNIPEDLRARMPGIEWKKIAGMRDWISHVYYRVDDDIVWDVVENKIPELLTTVQAFKEELTKGQISGSRDTIPN